MFEPLTHFLEKKSPHLLVKRWWHLDFRKFSSLKNYWSTKSTRPEMYFMQHSQPVKRGIKITRVQKVHAWELFVSHLIRWCFFYWISWWDKLLDEKSRLRIGLHATCVLEQLGPGCAITAMYTVQSISLVSRWDTLCSYYAVNLDWYHAYECQRWQNSSREKAPTIYITQKFFTHKNPPKPPELSYYKCVLSFVVWLDFKQINCQYYTLY